MKRTTRPCCQYRKELPVDAVEIPRFPKCYATPDGRIFTKIGMIKERRFGRNSCGYAVCGMRRDDGVRKFVMVHRIIAKVFVGGNTRLEVNHIDMNKLNNSATNLEWVTHSDNHRKARALLPGWAEKTGRGCSRAVVAIHPETGERHDFVSGKAAAIWAGNEYAGANICRAIQSGAISYGFKWVKKERQIPITASL